MGFFQRNTRVFFIVGILVMILSLGSFFFASNFGGASPQAARGDEARSETAATPDPNATPTPTPAPTEQPIVRRYSEPPAMTIDPSKSYEAIIRLESGEVRVKLLPDAAAEYVNNFVFLARNRFYDGLTFHRVVAGFVAQGGDPQGTGFGDSGYSLKEQRNQLTFDAGVLSMAKAGPRVSGSQFFITLGPAPHLNGQFTVFGRVTSGLDVLRGLQARDPASPGAGSAVVIRSIEIVEGAR